MAGHANIRTSTQLLIAVAVCLLASCGGGSNSSSDSADAAGSAAARPAALEQPAATPEAAAKVSTFEPEDEFASQTLKAINDARAVGRECGTTSYPPVAPLRWSSLATEAARIESDWMQVNNAWGHVWPDGTNVATRLERAGYDWQSAGENIAAGFMTLESVMQAWLESPGHCVNIMRADVDEVGVSLIWGESRNTYRSYWTMVLARPATD